MDVTVLLKLLKTHEVKKSFSGSFVLLFVALAFSRAAADIPNRQLGRWRCMRPCDRQPEASSVARPPAGGFRDLRQRELPKPRIWFPQRNPSRLPSFVMLDTSASMTGNLDLLIRAAEQFLIRMLPKDKGMVARSTTRSSSSRPRSPPQPRYADFVAQGPRFRQSDASLRRDCGQHGPMPQVDGLAGRAVLPDGDDTDSRVGSGECSTQAAQERSDDLTRWACGCDSSHGIASGANQARRWAEAAGRGNRRRLLRARKNRRAGAHLHASRTGAAQSVRARLYAYRARRQGPSPQRACQEARHVRPRAKELSRVSRIELTRHEFMKACYRR